VKGQLGAQIQVGASETGVVGIQKIVVTGSAKK